jgi:hypothetical protein
MPRKGEFLAGLIHICEDEYLPISVGGVGGDFNIICCQDEENENLLDVLIFLMISL